MGHECDRISKIATTQNIIRNKFKKTFADRLVHEHNVIRTMKPLTTVTTLSSPSKLTLKKQAIKTTASDGMNNINYLCAKLKKLIKKLSVNSSDNCNVELQYIISKLREHGIII